MPYQTWKILNFRATDTVLKVFSAKMAGDNPGIRSFINRGIIETYGKCFKLFITTLSCQSHIGT